MAKIRFLSTETRYKLGNGNRGKKWSEERKARHKVIMNNPRFKEKNGWKGDKVSYAGLHIWVNTHLGRPKYCAHCQDNSKPQRNYHWANISHKNRRDLSDWIRLCASCHKTYDMKFLKEEREEKVKSLEREIEMLKQEVASLKAKNIK